MKALVIAPQPFFSPRGTPFSVYYRTLVTAEFKNEIDFLTYGEGQDVDIPGVRILRIPRLKCLGNVKIGPSYLKLFLDFFIMIWATVLITRNHYDFVHAHEEAVFFCRFMKPIFRFKLIYDMHSSLPQQITNFNFSKSKIIIGLFKKLEHSCLHTSDAIITICPDLANYVNKLINDKEKHFLIENSIFEPIKLRSCTDMNVSASEVEEEVLKTLPAERKLVVYAGTLEPYQGIDILVESFREVLTIEPKSFLLIVGGTENQVQKYKKLAKKCSIITHCLFTGLVSQSLAKYYTSKASVLISPRSSGSNTPLKIYDNLNSGIPLVATKIYSHTQILNDDVAILVDLSPADMARGILSAFTGKGEEVAKNALLFYEKKYSRSVYKHKINKLLQLIQNS